MILLVPVFDLQILPEQGSTVLKGRRSLVHVQHTPSEPRQGPAKETTAFPALHSTGAKKVGDIKHATCVLNLI